MLLQRAALLPALRPRPGLQALVHGVWLMVYGLGFVAYGLFSMVMVHGLWFRVEDLGFRVLGLGFSFSEFRVEG